MRLWEVPWHRSAAHQHGRDYEQDDDPTSETLEFMHVRVSLPSADKRGSETNRQSADESAAGTGVIWRALACGARRRSLRVRNAFPVFKR